MEAHAPSAAALLCSCRSAWIKIRKNPLLASVLFLLAATIVMTVIWAAFTFTDLPWYKDVRRPLGRITRMWRVPWTDSLENVIIAFNLANKLRFEVDTVVTHMPGVYQFLAAFLRLFKISKGTPSTELVLPAVTASVFAMTLFQLVVTTAALRLLGLAKRAAHFGAVGIVSFTCLVFSTSMPLTENLLCFLVMLQVACFIGIVDPSVSRKKKALLAVWNLTFLPLVNLLIGLTIAPSVALMGLATLYATARAFDWSWPAKKDLSPLLLAPFVLTLALLVYEATVLDPQGMMFWNFEVNKGNLVASPWAIMSDTFRMHTLIFLKPRMPGATIWEVAIFSALAFFVWKKDGWPLRDRVTTVLLFLGMTFLANWRFNIGLKAEPVCGISWALAVILLRYKWPRLFSQNKMLPVPRMLFLATVAIAAISWTWAPLKIHAKGLPPRPAALDQANVCRFRTRTNCRCLQITVFSPQAFLENDIRQCQNRFSSFAPTIFFSDTVQNYLHSDFKRTDMAFIVFPEKMLNMPEGHVTPEVKRAFYEGGMKCIPYPGDLKLCYNEAEQK